MYAAPWANVDAAWTEFLGGSRNSQLANKTLGRKRGWNLDCNMRKLMSTTNSKAASIHTPLSTCRATRTRHSSDSGQRLNRQTHWRSSSSRHSIAHSTKPRKRRATCWSKVWSCFVKSRGRRSYSRLSSSAIVDSPEFLVIVAILLCSSLLPLSVIS